MASLHAGRSLNLSNIEEGDDVYFECSIKANPRVYKVVWRHEVRYRLPLSISISLDVKISFFHSS
ncbi:hypothetical protein E2C01_083856 [Portunus trituberculatus]|uniref:Ig-like domain-containing protein n=1 Tax=Portunus trituberculatus TaxID=210409 RepID=A0A5B7ITL2_PORTR|nr:hypothetical protein [Portunus trituberculatus]